jgi:hypothetical protein
VDTPQIPPLAILGSVNFVGSSRQDHQRSSRDVRLESSFPELALHTLRAARA